MTDSRLIKYDKRRLPTQKRTISIFGAMSYIDGRSVKDQSGKLFRCWNCGFVCNTDRDKLGDGEGFYITDKVDDYLGADTAYQYPCSDAPKRSALINVTTVSTIRLMQLDTNGDPIPVMHSQTQVVTSGCPMCGNRNYK